MGISRFEYEKLMVYYSTGQALFEEVIAIIHDRLAFNDWTKERHL